MKSRFCFIAFISICCIFCGCNKAVAESEVKDDSYYFLSLKAQATENEKESLLHKAISYSATSLVSRRAIERMIEVAAEEEKEQYINILLEKYSDDSALLTACRYYSGKKNYEKIIELTKDISIKEAPNELVRFRLAALQKNSIVHSLAREWFLCRAYSSEHQQFFDDYKKAFEYGDTEDAEEENEKEYYKENLDLMGFENEIYRLSYGGAYSYVEKGKIRKARFDFSDELMSDIGKACLYGKKDSYKSLPLLQKYLSHDDIDGEDVHCDYYRHFYSGRILERAGRGKIAASEEYKKAMEASFSEKTYDSALWYYLNAILGSSAQKAALEAEKYCDKWHDAEYFDDFFDTLSIRLFTNKNWKSIYRAYLKMSDYMSDEIAAQFAYISARLIDTKRISFSDVKDVWTILEVESEHIYKDLLEVSDKAYRRALKAGIKPYYSISAAKWLDDENISFSDILYTHQKTRDFKRDIDAETLLLGYLKFDLIDEMYDEWQNLRDNISLEVAAEIAEAYKKSGSDSDNRYSKALRIISYAANRDWSAPSKKALEQLFPRNFLALVQENAAQFSVSEPLVFGLIKSESYFDPTVSSVAGASGLTQLMDSTANDVARKLKMQPFDLLDAKTNITFGSYYISELIGRLEDSQILALFAYNGGISHVRSWLKSARLEYGENLPNDLFLEALPFAETREYGKKVVGAAAVYAYLYYGKSTASVVADIMD